LNQLQTLHTFGLNAQSAETHVIYSFDVLPIQSPSQPRWILGEGSNCIFVEDFEGAIWVNRVKGIEVSEQQDAHLLRVSSGENWHQLVVWCLHNKINGFENLALIPGTVGAAPIQNIGAYGREIASFITTVEVRDLVTGESFTLNNQECLFGYRDSVFKRPEANDWLITHVNFSMPKTAPLEISYGELQTLSNPTAHDVFNKVVEVRRQKLPDPAKLGNAGSFFKNPVISAEHFMGLKDEHPTIPHFSVDQQHVKVPAAWLIDQAGFKGQTRGGVQCHKRQPLVLLNCGNAKGHDVLLFAREIQASVAQRFGISLENEVRLVGQRGLVEL
jgi:UDP-N-acetylmuramate dehydrogenase